MRKTNLHWFWRDGSPLESFRTAISLHSHTMHSRETLELIPKFMADVPWLARAIRIEEERYRSFTGRTLDFSRAFWRPPLAPREALDLEKGQIESLDLNPLVSFSDHDDIQAGWLLAVLEPGFPASVEWTVPFGPTFFHLGLHNLPPQRAAEVMSDLAEYTRQPSPERLRALLAMLHEIDETLVILNHPLWDENRIGAVEHAHLLGRFLGQHGDYVHALELNGLRPWAENRRVMWLAEHSGHVLISGGDRHGLEPNANLNLTNARTFTEFVAEIREDRISDVLFLPQYREPPPLRMMETMWDILRDYPELPPERRRWSDRVFYIQDDGVSTPLSALWKGDGPWLVRCLLGALRAVANQQMRGAVRLALAGAQEARL